MTADLFETIYNDWNEVKYNIFDFLNFWLESMLKLTKRRYYRNKYFCCKSKYKRSKLRMKKF